MIYYFLIFISPMLVFQKKITRRCCVLCAGIAAGKNTSNKNYRKTPPSRLVSSSNGVNKTGFVETRTRASGMKAMKPLQIVTLFTPWPVFFSTGHSKFLFRIALQMN